MRTYFRRKDETYPSKPDKPHSISISGRDYSECEYNDATLKFWIPESLERKIDEVTDLLDTSVSDFVRQAIFIHLYGRCDLLGLYERKQGIYSPGGSIKFCASLVDQGPPISAPEKKNADVKIWLPARMKNDLAMLAVSHKMKLSSYVRQLLTIHLLGNLPFDPDVTVLNPPEGYEEE